MLFKRILTLSVLFSLFSCATLPKDELIPEEEKVSLYETHIDGAIEGIPADQIAIGLAYLDGMGISVDYAEAMNWFKQAAAKGEAEAYYRIGYLYEMGLGVKKSEDDAREWYFSSAANDFVPAIRKLIQIFEGNTEEQLFWIERGLQSDDPYSHYRYGLILEESEKDKALIHFHKAVHAEETEAKALISILSLGERLSHYSSDEALLNIMEGAENGDSRSLVFLGWLKEFGDGMEKSGREAFVLYEQASRMNSQLAIYNLSRFYGEGISVAVDPGKSNLYFNQLDQSAWTPSYYDLLDYGTAHKRKRQLQVLYRFRASLGDPAAQYELGKLAAPDESLHWFWLSAQEGYVPAMVELSRVYLNTGTAEFNQIEGAAWLMVAENSGYSDDSYNSTQILSTFSDEEKMEVSLRFTELFYRDNSVYGSGFVP